MLAFARIEDCFSGCGVEVICVVLVEVPLECGYDVGVELFGDVVVDDRERLLGAACWLVWVW